MIFFHSQDCSFVYITGISCNELYAIKNCFLLITEELLVKLLRIHVVPPTHPLRPGRNPYFRTFQVKKSGTMFLFTSLIQLLFNVSVCKEQNGALDAPTRD